MTLSSHAWTGRTGYTWEYLKPVEKKGRYSPMKKSTMFLLVMLFTLGFAGLASAHVTVQPSTAPAGSYQVFTVRVPTELKVATTQVKVAIPEGVDVTRFEPKSDWTYTPEMNADGKITSVTWKTSGSGLSPTEFGDFRMQGKVADDAKELVWKAYQTYADGTLVEWTGAADADKPASVTTITAAVAADGHGAATAGASEVNERDPLTLSLAIAGLAAGVLALLVALFRKRA
jgi:uncharacterized protein YcnI